MWFKFNQFYNKTSECLINCISTSNSSVNSSVKTFDNFFSTKRLVNVNVKEI